MRDIHALAAGDQGDDVYQVVVSLFPLTMIHRKSGGTGDRPL
jgi:hypothetical protein